MCAMLICITLTTLLSAVLKQGLCCFLLTHTQFVSEGLKLNTTSYADISVLEDIINHR